jgi:hypothetical protein
MKTIMFSIDLKSFFLGALTVGGILTMANFTPANKQQLEPGLGDNRRFQASTSERETIILDTQTGRFVVSPSYLGQPRWIKGDFEDILTKERK